MYKYVKARDCQVMERAGVERKEGSVGGWNRQKRPLGRGALQAEKELAAWKLGGDHSRKRGWLLPAEVPGQHTAA